MAVTRVSSVGGRTASRPATTASASVVARMRQAARLARLPRHSRRVTRERPRIDRSQPRPGQTRPRFHRSARSAWSPARTPGSAPHMPRHSRPAPESTAHSTVWSCSVDEDIGAGSVQSAPTREAVLAPIRQRAQPRSCPHRSPPEAPTSWPCWCQLPAADPVALLLAFCVVAPGNQRAPGHRRQRRRLRIGGAQRIGHAHPVTRRRRNPAASCSSWTSRRRSDSTCPRWRRGTTETTSAARRAPPR